MCVLEYQIWTRHRIEILISREMMIIKLIGVDHHNCDVGADQDVDQDR